MRTQGTPLPTKIATGSEFPIYGDADKYTDNRARKIGGIDPAAQTVIDGLQPFNQRAGPEPDPLWLLNELQRIDKHRTLHMTLAKLENVKLLAGSFARITVDSPFGVLEAEREVLRYVPVTATNPGFSLNKPGKAVFDYGLSVVFAQPPANGASVISALEMLKSHLTNMVIPALKKFLPQRGH